jgi:hypothetical protein
MVPLVTGRLPWEIVKKLGRFSRALRRLLSHQPLPHQELDRLEDAMWEFVRFFEATFYRGDYEKVHVCTSNLHQLVHLVQCIRSNGPLWAYSQWGMERLIGRLVKSIPANGAPFTALANNVLLDAQLQDNGMLDCFRPLHYPLP